MRPEDYANIRELLPIEGRRVVLVTQHDLADWLCGEPARVSLHLDDGSTVTFEFEGPCGRLYLELL